MSVPLISFISSVLWFIVPNAFSKMCPKDIRNAVPPCQKSELITLACVLYPLYILIVAYIPFSAHMEVDTLIFIVRSVFGDYPQEEVRLQSQ